MQLRLEKTAAISKIMVDKNDEIEVILSDRPPLGRMLQLDELEYLLKDRATGDLNSLTQLGLDLCGGRHCLL